MRNKLTVCILKINLAIFTALFFTTSCKNPKIEPSFPNQTFKKIEPSFPNQTFKKVVAYKMKGQFENVIENNRLSNNVDDRSVELNNTQIDRFIKIVNSPKSYGGVTAACFEPHLGLVFYDKKDKIIAHSTICLVCNNMNTSPKIDEFGFSKNGARAISKLEKEIFNE